MKSLQDRTKAAETVAEIDKIQEEVLDIIKFYKDLTKERSGDINGLLARIEQFKVTHKAHYIVKDNYMEVGL